MSNHILFSENSTITAPVNKIIRFSSVDGPGNRTALFLQGCNFDCKYCHNPETRSLCINCGKCVADCPTHALTRSVSGLVCFHPEKCISCDHCIKICPNDASPRIINMTPDQAFTEIRKQIPYIRGITVSGGECTLYPDFIRELFALCHKSGLTTMIDSNGTYDFETDPARLLPVTDGVMLDIKAFDRNQHMEVTGTANEAVLKNAVFLADQRRLFEVRTVLVPDLFDCEQCVRQTGELLRDYQPIRYKLIRFRPMGVRESYREFASPSDELMDRCEKLLRSLDWEDIVQI